VDRLHQPVAGEGLPTTREDGIDLKPLEAPHEGMIIIREWLTNE